MRILVCGGRKFSNIRVMFDYLDFHFEEMDNITLISGHAPGADQMAEQWADTLGFPVEVYPANWKKYGNGAGHIRNRQMLEEGKPDLVIAFPGGTGTANMVKIAREAGVTVKEIEEYGNEKYYSKEGSGQEDHS